MPSRSSTGYACVRELTREQKRCDADESASAALQAEPAGG